VALEIIDVGKNGQHMNFKAAAVVEEGYVIMDGSNIVN